MDQKGKLKLTVAGVSKQMALDYMLNKYGRAGTFTHFKTGLEIAETATGKLTHTYVDEEIEGDITDVYGNAGHYHELSYIHLSAASYVMSRSQDYIDYLKGVY